MDKAEKLAEMDSLLRNVDFFAENPLLGDRLRRNVLEQLDDIELEGESLQAVAGGGLREELPWLRKK